MLVVGFLHDVAVELSSISSIQIKKIGEDISFSDKGFIDDIGSYAVRVDCGSNEPIVLYSTPALEDNRPKVFNVYKNLLALKAGELKETFNKPVIVIDEDFENYELWENSPSLSNLNVYLKQ